MESIEVIGLLNFTALVALIFIVYRNMLTLSDIKKENHHLRTLPFIHHELKDMNLLVRNKFLSSENQPVRRTWRG